MLLRTKGAPKYEFFPKAASTVFSIGDLVAFNASGQVIPAASGTTTGIVGICKRAVVATDSDYAANTPIAIDVNIAGGGNEFEADASGTVTAAMVGTYKDIGANAGTISIAAPTNNHVVVRGLSGLSTTKMRCGINANAMIA